MSYYCIGEHLTHSFSPEIHAAIGGYDYHLRELSPGALPDFMTHRAFSGINVTIPYKQAVIPYLTALDDRARAIGAVNTIVNRNGCLFGYNTDFAGMTAMLAHAGISLSGKKVLILGSGGTSRTAHAVATHLGAAAIETVSRHPEFGQISYETAMTHHPDAAVILNTTPCGMHPHPEGLPIDLAAFSHLSGVADVIYNPLRTALTLEAKKRGIPAVNGLYMLVAQAVYAAGLFLDRQPELAEIERIYRTLLSRKENIVLVGMPASGKTTVGKQLAAELERPFFDLDHMIEAQAGKDIPSIFADKGETGFRDLETAVLKSSAAAKTGCVLAVGGGTVLREENVDWLRRNGRLYFLDRTPEKLVPTADRPLASSATAIRQRYNERYPLYCRVADVHIDGNGSVAETVSRIREERQ